MPKPFVCRGNEGGNLRRAGRAHEKARRSGLFPGPEVSGRLLGVARQGAVATHHRQGVAQDLFARRILAREDLAEMLLGDLGEVRPVLASTPSSTA